jgi:TatD DNase family protein
MVVNSSSEEDWDEVARMAATDRAILPGYGLHPWRHQQRSDAWLDRLTEYLQDDKAGVGEIGLDRWKQDLPYEGQEEVFLAQWNLARQLNRPASVHCLKAWGRLLELVRAHPAPECGFLLHSYGGPVEMVEAFVGLGAYFSFPGYYMHPGKSKQQETFRHVPLDRLLVETDAPDQRLPDEANGFPLVDADGHPINHPANLATVYAYAAQLRGLPLADFAASIGQNFRRLFGGKF